MTDNIPSDRRYSETHEWGQANGDLVTVGLTDHGQRQLGDVVYLEMPNVGQSCTAGGTFGSLQTVKGTSDVYAPVSGTVVEVNDAAVEDPGLLNEDP